MSREQTLPVDSSSAVANGGHCDVQLPWDAWSNDAVHRIQLPRGCTAHYLWPPDAPPWTRDQIRHAIASPIGTQSLVELARGRHRACVVVDDMSRPTRAGDVLPDLLAQLHTAGLPRDAITIIIATGTHSAPNDRQIAMKLGNEVAAAYRVVCHDAEAELVGTGMQFGNSELRINADFMAADLRIAIGAVLPHPFAGYSGGAKSVLPGLADVSATARSHKFVQMGLRGGNDPNTNRFRTEAEDIVRRLGLDFIVSVVPNVRRETAGVCAGDLVACHRAACRVAVAAYATTFSTTYDCLILGSYPKDSEIVQSEAAFTALQGPGLAVVNDSGLIVLTVAGTSGIGKHGLFAPGGVSYRKPQPKRMLGKRELWIYSPSATLDDVRQIYWEGYPVFRDATALRDAWGTRFPRGASVAVLPSGPMQQLVDLRV